MINVTRTYLPELDDYIAILKRAWDKKWITNNGELVLELEEKLKQYHRLDHLMFCTNGTIVLQMALKALGEKGEKGEIITTPFSYVATTNTILWEGFKPVFADINSRDFNIDADQIESKITKDTVGILATHVYGNPCDVEKIEAIAKKHNLKVIYDGAHAFGVTYKERSLLSYGDISTCSFHATKLFHTVEGGSISVHDEELRKQIYLYRQFGHVYDDYFSEGINGKNSEFHAAMGLAVFPHIERIKANRKSISMSYDEGLKGMDISKPVALIGTEINYGYYPILFRSENDLMKVTEALNKNDISGRRYFYPSLNELPFLKEKQDCPVSEDISRRVYCLPLYPGLEDHSIELICNTIRQTLKS